MYLQAKWNKKGAKRAEKKGAQSGGFTVALFLALFALALLSYLKKWEKGRKKGVKKGGKRVTVNDPNKEIDHELKYSHDRDHRVIIPLATLVTILGKLQRASEDFGSGEYGVGDGYKAIIRGTKLTCRFG
ncbi:hypothetical protein C8F04DRAFT_1198899 [Mycena alexandri]|uniref:Uncharacterized protein n=1 Tax=Mycena alexandri TaxID=1745969 RepID=A0AAD6RZN6_9AGAR|nr:hypothetical protein C8F04DRAFT_1198899 [Mycena alexandri]